MAVLVNQVLGSPPKKNDEIVNIYAFNIGQDIYIETIDINYLLLNVTNSFFEKFIDSKMQKFSPQDRKGAFRREFSSSYKIKSKVHLMLYKPDHTLRLTEENLEPRKKSEGTDIYNEHVNLVKGVGNWVKANPEFFGEKDFSDLKAKSNIRHWQHQNYAIYSINDFPALAKAVGDYKDIGPFRGATILGVDYYDTTITEALKGQIGRDFTLEDPTVTQKFIDIEGQTLKPPTIIFNMRGKSELAIEKTLYSIIAEGSGVSLLDRTKLALEKQVEFGSSLEDLFYFHFGGKKGSQVVPQIAKEFDKDAPEGTKKQVEKSAEQLNINPNDKETLDFFKTFSIYKEVFPPINSVGTQSERYNKKFYYVVSIPKTGVAIPPDPATKNHDLFLEKKGEEFIHPFSQGLFTVVKVLASEESSRIYYLLSSKYCFPQSVFSLFIYKPVVEEGAKTEAPQDIDLHNIFQFNEVNGVLSKYPFVNNTPKDSYEKTFYGTAVLLNFPTEIVKELGDKIVDNRFNEGVIVKSLSDFPYVYNTVKKWFDEYKIEYKDLNVVFVVDNTPQGANNLGGYTSQRMMNDEVIDLTRTPEGQPKKYKDFTLPIIFLNMAHPRMQLGENTSKILIHESRHYFDDMMANAGKLDPNFMKYPEEYTNAKDRLSKQRAYYGSGVELNAFAEEALSIFRRYSLDYVNRNYTSLKNQIIHNYFMQLPQQRMSGLDREGNKIVVDQTFVDLFSNMVDKAYWVYEKENSTSELETPV